MRGGLVNLRGRMAVVIRSRVLRAIVDFYGFDPTDDIEMTEPQDLTDRIMLSLFGPWPPPPT